MGSCLSLSQALCPSHTISNFDHGLTLCDDNQGDYLRKFDNMAPIVYDANSPEEYPVPLPSAPLVILSENAVLQPPLTRRGTGPGMVIFLPPTSGLNISSEKDKPLDPKPVQKWAEEGFTVVGVTIDGSGWSAESALNNAVNALLPLDVLSIKDKFAVLGGKYTNICVTIPHQPP